MPFHSCASDENGEVWVPSGGLTFYEDVTDVVWTISQKDRRALGRTTSTAGEYGFKAIQPLAEVLVLVVLLPEGDMKALLNEGLLTTHPRGPGRAVAQWTLHGHIKITPRCEAANSVKIPLTGPLQLNGFIQSHKLGTHIQDPDMFKKFVDWKQTDDQRNKDHKARLQEAWKAEMARLAVSIPAQADVSKKRKAELKGTTETLQTQKRLLKESTEKEDYMQALRSRGSHIISKLDGGLFPHDVMFPQETFHGEYEDGRSSSSAIGE